MSLHRLDITGVRNLRSARLEGLRRVNLFYGENGGGKTSILESIYLLGTSRSFRSSRIKAFITHGEDRCTVFGEVSGSGSDRLPVGVQRDQEGTLQIKVGGGSVKSTSELAEHLPLLVINADSFALLVGTPLDRRQFLDWGVFHVEHGFQRNWQRFQRSIKQRNELLRRDKIPAAELEPWTLELSESGEKLHAARERYFEALREAFGELISRLSPAMGGLELRYRRGWDRERSLREALRSSEATDRAQGFTHVGPQRADVRISVDGFGAGDTLSRGQQKLVVCALKLAQGKLLAEQTGRTCVYLVDDLPAELDEQHSRLVAEVLDDMDAQVMITCVAKEEIVSVWPQKSVAELAVFHVEHGAITQVST